MGKGGEKMYKVIYMMAGVSIREVYMTWEELKGWLSHRWLKERIIGYEKVDKLENKTSRV